MSLWRIRITMSDDPQSEAMLTAALAEQRVWALLISPGDTEMTGDVIIELPRDDGLGALLSELQMISPQIFMSRVDQPSSLATARPLRNGAPLAPVASSGGIYSPRRLASLPSLREPTPHYQLGKSQSRSAAYLRTP